MRSSIPIPPFPPGLLSQGTERTYAPGEIMYTARSEAVRLYVIIEGHVRVVREGGGRMHVIHDEGPGGTLGEVPMFEGGRYPATAVAASRTRCILIPYDVIHEAVHADPEIAFVLLARLSRRVRRLVEQLDSRTGFGTLQRLAQRILERAGDGDEAGTMFTLGGTQHEVAQSIGTVRELVVRGLRSLRDDHIISAGTVGRYSLLDRRRLEEIASGGPAATALRGMIE